MNKTGRTMDAFMKTLTEGVTFDDVSLVPGYADFLPCDTDISSQLTRNISMSIPFVSAAMDTVTEGRMAIAMAMLGGIGIIHKNLHAEKQAQEVELVKHHLNGLIPNPVTFKANDTLKNIFDTKNAKSHTFSGFPILDDDGKLVGIITAADMKFAGNLNIEVSKIMTTQVITASPKTSLKKAYDLMMKNKIGKLPLVDEKGRLTGLYSFSDVKTLIEKAEPMFNRDARHRLRVGAAVGARDHERVEILAEKDIDVIVIDTAHGHSKGVVEMCKWIKGKYPAVDVIAGNIATPAAALALRKAGADAVKVGIGPGSICTTRVVAGVGVPQVSAVYECAKALAGSIPVISDGGIRFSGDVPKALAAGAQTVMIGSVLAGTDESPGEKIIQHGRQYVIYRGMGSLPALKSGYGSRDRYAQADVAEDQLIPEGIEGLVPHVGTVAKVMTQFCGGLRASLGYCGCKNIKELIRSATFVRISNAGMRESHPHDIKITREAPNYSIGGLP